MDLNLLARWSTDARLASLSLLTGPPDEETYKFLVDGKKLYDYLKAGCEADQKESLLPNEVSSVLAWRLLGFVDVDDFLYVGELIEKVIEGQVKLNNDQKVSLIGFFNYCRDRFCFIIAEEG